MMGTDMSIESAAPAEQSKDIETDLSCSKCSYNLKGLQSGGNCPECGQPIEQTINFGLDCADPAWLKYQSVTMLLLAALAVTPPGYDIDRQNGWYFHGLRVLWTVLASYASWRLTRPDPKDRSDRNGPWRRGLMAAAAFALAVSLFVPVDHDRRGNLTANFFIRIAATMAQCWLALLLVFRLTARTSYVLLKRHAYFCLWAFPISQLLPWIGWFIFNATDLTSSFEMYQAVVSTLNWLASLVPIVMLLLFGRMHEVLRTAAAQAAPRSLSSPESCPSSVPTLPTNLEPGSSSAAP